VVRAAELSVREQSGSSQGAVREHKAGPAAGEQAKFLK
jgi:hypothetical protein